MRQLTKAAIFIAAPMIKTYLAAHFTKGYFFCQIVNRKVVGLMPKYYVLATDTNQFSIFFLTQDKNK